MCFCQLFNESVRRTDKIRLKRSWHKLKTKFNPDRRPYFVQDYIILRVHPEQFIFVVLHRLLNFLGKISTEQIVLLISSVVLSWKTEIGLLSVYMKQCILLVPIALLWLLFVKRIRYTCYACTHNTLLIIVSFLKHTTTRLLAKLSK